MKVPIICMICGQDIPEEEYTDHMATVHKGKSQLQAIAEEKSKEQDVPKVIPLDKNAPIDPEFEKTLAEMAKTPPPKPVPTPPALGSPLSPGGEPKKLELKYRWEGNCPTCNSPVRTIVTTIDGRWFVSAYCLTHETISQTEVHPLSPKLAELKESNKEKEVEDGGKPDISEEASSSTEMRPVRESKPKRIPDKS